MADEARRLHVTATSFGEGNESGLARVKCADDAGNEFVIPLDTFQAQTLGSSLLGMLNDLAADRRALPRDAGYLTQISVESFAERECIRMYLASGVYHEYSTQKRSNLARILLRLGDLMEQDQKASHPGSEKKQ